MNLIKRELCASEDSGYRGSIMLLPLRNRKRYAAGAHVLIYRILCQGRNQIEGIGAMVSTYPLKNQYWEDKVMNPECIEVPS